MERYYTHVETQPDPRRLSSVIVFTGTGVEGREVEVTAENDWRYPDNKSGVER
jgi:hypothetical protein